MLSEKIHSFELAFTSHVVNIKDEVNTINPKAVLIFTSHVVNIKEEKFKIYIDK